MIASNFYIRTCIHIYSRALCSLCNQTSTTGWSCDTFLAFNLGDAFALPHCTLSLMYSSSQNSYRHLSDINILISFYLICKMWDGTRGQSHDQYWMTTIKSEKVKWKKVQNMTSCRQLLVILSCQYVILYISLSREKRIDFLPSATRTRKIFSNWEHQAKLSMVITEPVWWKGDIWG